MNTYGTINLNQTFTEIPEFLLLKMELLKQMALIKVKILVALYAKEPEPESKSKSE